MAARHDRTKSAFMLALKHPFGHSACGTLQCISFLNLACRNAHDVGGLVDHIGGASLSLRYLGHIRTVSQTGGRATPLIGRTLPMFESGEISSVLSPLPNGM